MALHTLSQPARARHGVPTLRDGSSLNDLFDLKDRAVSMRLLSDPEIYDLEMARLFGKAWVVLAHESEIPHEGDFVVRQLGSDSVIVVRHKSDRINVLLNACTHRGMELARAEVGHAIRFRCPYHGWTFDRGGLFVGAPCAAEMYGDTLNKAAWALKSARVEIFAGMIFASWDPQAPTLTEYLGDIKFYLSLMFERTHSGLESVGPPQRWIIPANWKAASEQFAGDGYHSLTLHGSVFELGGMRPGDLSVITGIDVSTPRGHGLLCRSTDSAFDVTRGLRPGAAPPLESLRKLPPPGVPAERVDELAARYDQDALRLLAECPPIVGQIFPNAAVMSHHIFSAEGLGANITIRTWNPHGPDQMEVLSWTLVERSASRAQQRSNRKSTLQGFGSSGMIEQEDAEVWPSQSRTARGHWGKQQWLRYPARHEPARPEGWPGGGLIYSGISKDDNQWNWWTSYYEFLTNTAW